MTAGSTKPDLDAFKDLPLEELEKAKKKLEDFVTKRRESRRKEALQQIKQLVAEHELGFDEVVNAIRTTARRGKAPALYRNPANPRQTWSGKGEPPQWYTKARDKEALRIPES